MTTPLPENAPESAMRMVRRLAAPGLFLASAFAQLIALEASGAAGWWLLTACTEGLTVGIAWLALLGWGGVVRWWLGLGAMEGAVPRFAARAGLGLATGMLLGHGLGLAGMLHPVAWGVVGGAGLAALAAGPGVREVGRRAVAVLEHPAAVVAAPLAAVLLVAASVPPGILWPREGAGYDALAYHLQVPREWLAAGAVRPLEHNVYSFLPLNLEFLSPGFFALRGGAHGGALAVQWFHASLSIAVAGLLAAWVGGRTGSRAAGTAAAVIWLALPWNLHTASLAYNEQGAAFLGLCAWVLLWERGMAGRGAAVAAGICAGGAVGVKLTAAGMLAVPVLLGFVTWRDREESLRSPRRIGVAAGVFLAAALMMQAPWLARNAAWTGNPVFPFATRVLGKGHWNTAEEWRWMDGHRPKAPWKERLGALWRHGPADPGFGAAWWLAVAAGLAAALARRERRPLAAGAATAVAVGVVAWLSATHLQPRFLQPLALPLAVAAGLGAAVLPGRAALVLAAAFAAGHAGWQGGQLRAAANPERLPPASETLRDPVVLSAFLESDLLAGQTTLLVGEARGWLYPEGTVYATPFDRAPFADAWRAAGGEPRKVLEVLRARGVTQIVANFEELDRLRDTYGSDPEVTPAALDALVRAGGREVQVGLPGIRVVALGE